MATDHGHNLDAFDALFDDDILAQLAADDRLTDRLIDIVETGLNVVELILASGDINSQLAALQKILPLATKVADKRASFLLPDVGKIQLAIVPQAVPGLTRPSIFTPDHACPAPAPPGMTCPGPDTGQGHIIRRAGQMMPRD